jgi:hypothetical protein
MTPPPTLRPYQLEAVRAITESVIDGRGLTFTVVMARQAGKNELSAQIELFLLLRNARISIDAIKAAPSFDPQGRISMNRLWSRVTGAHIGGSAVREQGRAVRVGLARVVFLSAESTSNVVGHTAGLLLEVDEAQDIDRDKFDREFRPMASSTGATTVYYGTPWDDSTLLERAVQHNLELQRRDGIRRHFAADWQEVAPHNATYARFVEAERQRLGENHPLFLTQYALKPVAGAGHLFSAAQRAQLAGTHARQHAPIDGETYVAGLDIGGGQGDGGEHDATVLTIARAVYPAWDALVRSPRLEVVEQIAFTAVPHDDLFARLADILGRVWRVRRLYIDSTGIGETLAHMLKGTLELSVGKDVVRPLKLTTESKSNLGHELLAAVNSGRLRMYAPDGSTEHAECARQLELARITYRPSQQINFYVDPAEGHDDYLVSLALTVHAGNEGIAEPRIARGRLPNQVSRNTSVVGAFQPREMSRIN